MKKLRNKIDSAIIGAKCRLMEKREGSDQLIVMFIIIAVAAGIAGLLYIFGKDTLLPNIQNKLTTWILGNVTRIPHYELSKPLDFTDFLPLFT